MHSSKFLATARHADNYFFADVVAMADCAFADGCFPSAWVILSRPEHPNTGYSVHRVIFNGNESWLDIRDGVEVSMFFDSGHYDLNRERAWQIFNEKTARDCNRPGDDVREKVSG